MEYHNERHSRVSDEMPVMDSVRDEKKLHATIPSSEVTDESQRRSSKPEPVAKKTTLFRSSIFWFVAAILTSCFLLQVYPGWGTHLPDEVADNQPPRATGTRQSARAKNFMLDFPALYPPLRANGNAVHTKTCMKAWESLSSVPCHEKIFHRGWDNGTWMPLLSISPLRYLPLLCRATCYDALQEAADLISKTCPPSIEFYTAGYKGMFNLTLLEQGPADAVNVLRRRNEHSCRQGDDSEWVQCLTDMTERWGILDGINHQNLRGLGVFLKETDKKRVEKGGVKSFTRGSGSDGGWKRTFRIQVPTRRFGPGIGETDCGWCTLDWLENTLNAWEPGQVISPDTGNPISLSEHLKRVRQAGQRCEASKWGTIFETAIRRYTREGLLAPDWGTHGSSDYSWTIKNGPGEGDYPLPQIAIAVQSILKDGVPERSSPAADALRCLEKLQSHIGSLPCKIHLDRPQLESLIQPDNPLLDSYCRDECTSAIAKGNNSLKACRYKRTNEHESAGPILGEYDAARATREKICFKATGAGKQALPCASVFVGLGRPEWAIDGRPAVSDIEKLVEELELQPIPDIVKAAVGKSSDAPEKRALQKEYRKWDKDLQAGVCSPCIWQMVVGNGDIARTMASIRAVEDLDAYLAFAHRFHNACTARGASWLGGLPYGGDDVVWRVQEEDGTVYRFIVDTSKTSRFKGQWKRAEEASDKVITLHYHYGSLWHLRAAARRVRAEREGRFEELVRLERLHMNEEDAKVWKAAEVLSGPRWIGRPRKTES
ncbi:hypothetical protein F5Y15DRAFT_100249 [Xylariaceae sp. FL0016]|nr:hypothetical protein F5Y15DRAFT_100249 [Xylariaceae sp. FL0016]